MWVWRTLSMNMVQLNSEIDGNFEDLSYVVHAGQDLKLSTVFSDITI